MTDCQTGFGKKMSNEINVKFCQENAYFVRESITLRLTSCFICLD